MLTLKVVKKASFHYILLLNINLLKQLKLSFDLVQESLSTVKRKNLHYTFAHDMGVIKWQRYNKYYHLELLSQSNLNYLRLNISFNDDSCMCR